MGSSLAMQTFFDVESTPVLLHWSVAVFRFPADVLHCILMHVDTHSGSDYTNLRVRLREPAEVDLAQAEHIMHSASGYTRKSYTPPVRRRRELLECPLRIADMIISHL